MNRVVGFALIVASLSSSVASAALPQHFHGRWELSFVYFGNVNGYTWYAPHERVQVLIAEASIRVRQPDDLAALELTIVAEEIFPSLGDWLVSASPAYHGNQAFPFATVCDPVVLSFITESLLVPLATGGTVELCESPPCIGLRHDGCSDTGAWFLTSTTGPLPIASKSWSAFKARFH